VQLRRRKLLQFTAAAASVAMLPRIAAADDRYPTHPVRFIVGAPPGGALDLAARLVGAFLSQRFGQSFVIENRPGAGSNLATEMVVRAAPDGYTLLLVGLAAAVNATLYDNLPFNFIRDIAPVAPISREPNFLVVHPSFPARSVPEFIAYAKANPHQITMASSGNGTSVHVAGELFMMMTGVDLIHVPYRGGAPALTDLIAGQVQVMFAIASSSVGYIRAGKLVALAVTTAARSPALPDVPALAEFVPGYEASTWLGLGVPKGTPAGIIGLLNKQVNAAAADPVIKGRLAGLGSTTVSGSSADFAAHIAEETEKWGKVIRFAGLKAE
jgi:tripartite-type tricarboxylate transporter receptor subunit TctC